MIHAETPRLAAPETTVAVAHVAMTIATTIEAATDGTGQTEIKTEDEAEIETTVRMRTENGAGNVFAAGTLTGTLVGTTLTESNESAGRKSPL